MNGDLVTVATFADGASAALARNQLEHAGIRAVVNDAETVAMDWLLASAVGGIKLQVLEKDKEQAERILRLERGTIDVPTDDDEDAELTEREAIARRAFRGSVFGLLFCPLQFYILVLLAKIYSSSERLERPYRTQAFIALALCLCTIGAWILYLLAAFQPTTP